jgi:hypothetical protein
MSVNLREDRQQGAEANIWTKVNVEEIWKKLRNILG